MIIKRLALTLLFGGLTANFAIAEDIDVSADQVDYQQETNSVAASGNVELSTTDRTLYADDVTYDRANGTVKAAGNVAYVDDNDISVFVDDMTLNSELNTGEMNNIQMRMANDGPAMVAKKASRPNDHTYVLESVTYSPCKTCGSKDTTQETATKEISNRPVAPKAKDANIRLPWQIRADKVTYDIEEAKVTYENAKLDVYGVPILYFPYFKHPAGTQKPQSGFLPPRFGRSTSRGEEVTIGYYKNIDPSTDYTVRTRYMTQRGAQLQLEHRRITRKFAGEFRGSIIEDDKTDSIRSHIDANAEYTIKRGFRVGMNTQIAADQTYLDDFYAKTDSYIPTTVYAEKADKDFYANVYSTYYQDLRKEADESRTAQVLPSFTLSKTFYTDKRGGQLDLSTNLLSIHRDEGDKSRRLLTQVGYSKPWVVGNGHLFEVSANVRGDVYNVENDLASEKDGFTTRGLVETAIKWERAMTSTSGYHTFTPKAMLAVAPRGGNPADIPNEDSVAYELDTTNLFETNRFAGEDRVENGTRFIYGLDNYWGNSGRKDWRVFFGQSYRFHDDNTLPELSGASTKASDWVGLVDMTPNDMFAWTNSARLDNSDFTAHRWDSNFRVGEVNKTNLTVGYSFLDGGAEEATIKGRYDINNAISLRAETRQDLTEGGKQLLSEVEALYTHNCYRLSFIARRRGFDNENVPPSTDFLFNIELLTLGRDHD